MINNKQPVNNIKTYFREINKIVESMCYGNKEQRAKTKRWIYGIFIFLIVAILICLIFNGQAPIGGVLSYLIFLAKNKIASVLKF